MRSRDIVDLLLLAMLWGGSFLFMRLAVPEFGPLPLVEMRVLVAALFLLPLMLRHHRADVLSRNWRGLAFIGITNSAIPFALFSFAMLSITSGFAAILNSTSPLFAGVIAWIWLRDRLPWMRAAGLLVGFAGVALLVWGKPTFSLRGDALAIAAAIGASLSYGFSPNFIKRHMTQVPPIVIATGSQVVAAIVVLPMAIAQWPATTPSTIAWLSAVAIGVGCTGIAYILYFRLIRNVGPTRAIAVTFLIPGFGMLYGALFLGEPVTAGMIAGCAVILAGTALATGVIDARPFARRTVDRATK
nr:drug/metabolite transporter (DMT) superfamily permease [uncultured bacterium]